MNKFKCPLSLISNPFFIKIKLLDTEILHLRTFKMPILA